MSDLRGLIERVEKAVGPDRELDADICIALGYLSHVDAPLNLRRSEDEGWLDYEVDEDGDGFVAYTDLQPSLTFSVDATLALVEKMRPGYRWGVSSVAIKIGAHPDGKTAYGEGFRAHVTKNSPLRPMPSTADAPTPALAIVLALLRALDSQGVGE